MYQYRITVNGVQGQIESYPKRWSHITEQIESRGGIAILERRLVTDLSYLEYQPDNIMVLGDKVVTYWIIFAKVEL